MITEDSHLTPVLFPIDSIVVGERMRKDMGDIADLAESFKEVGQMQPVGIDEKRNLVFGGRRYAAAKSLGWATIKVVLAETGGSQTKLRMMELEENLRRKDMNWKERVTSIAEIHLMHVKEAHLQGERWGERQTADLFNVSKGNIGYCLQLSRLLADQTHPIQNCDGVLEAIRLLVQMKEDEGNRLLANMTLPPVSTAPQIRNVAVEELLASLPEVEIQPYVANTCVACSGTGVNSKGDTCPICKGVLVAAIKDETITIPLSQMFIMQDAIEWLMNQKSQFVDHIVSDPPYGIEMDNLSQTNTGMDVTRTEAEHDVEENLALFEDFLPLAFEALKPDGFCVLWCDAMHFRLLHDRAIFHGFKVQRWPLIWCKTGPCTNQANQYNFTKRTEYAIVMRKGGTLVSHQNDNYIVAGPADKKLFHHPFAKPIEVWQWILRAIAIPGQTILDPFAGSGSCCYSAAAMGLRPIGVEKVEVHFCNLINVMRTGYTTWMLPKKVQFT